MSESRVEDRRTLTFEDDPGASRSVWVAAGIVLALVLWMGSGFVLPDNADGASESADQPPDAPFGVAVRTSEARPVTRYFRGEGQAEPDRDTAIRAETSGEVAEVLAEKGDRVAEGQILARLDAARAASEVERAREELARAEREFENATTLLERGAGTVDRVADTRAALAAAEAALTQAEEALADTEIRAPFGGRLEALTLDPGEFVQSGTVVGRVLDTDPLTVSVQVPQQALGRLEAGQTAEVSFITGEVREGRIAFLGASAQEGTRTFRAEIEVPNPEGRIPAGISAEVRVATGETVAHFLSPAILSLGPEGALGVKTVTADDAVAFHEVAIVRAETDGIWVTGLPETARIITVGQGFVSAGETVTPHADGAVR